MSSNPRPQISHGNGGLTTEGTLFEQQREALVGEIAIVMTLSPIISPYLYCRLT